MTNSLAATTVTVFSVAGRQAHAQRMEALVVGVFFEDSSDQVIVLAHNESVRDILQERGERRRFIEASLGTTQRQFAAGESFDTLMDGYRRTLHGI